MEITKILDFENKGLRMIVEGHFLYLGSKGAISKYHLSDMSLVAHTPIKPHNKKHVYSMLFFSIFDEYIFVSDFCNLHVVQKEDLQLLYTVRLGENASSDVLGAIHFDSPNAYINIRNGRIDLFNIYTKKATQFEISDSSSWANCVVGNRIYFGTTKGELLEIEKDTLQVIRKVQLTKNMNIYSIAFHNDLLYTTSEKSFKVVDVNTFELTVLSGVLHSIEERKLGIHSEAFHSTEANIIGICNEVFVVAELKKIALFDTQTLELRERFDFPTGYRFLRYAILSGDKLYGSDEHGIYCRLLRW